MYISFCLPGHAFKTIIGGYKIVFEYANRLSVHGHHVTLVMNTEKSLRWLVKNEWLRRFICRIVVRFSPNWFKLDKRVKKISACGLLDPYIPDGDAVFATAVDTAESVSRLNPRKGKKYYLIQGFETWSCDEEYVLSTYKMGLRNIAVSKWLREIVQSSGTDCFYLPNPINTEQFCIKRDVTERARHSIGVLYHESTHKGFEYAYEVIKTLKKKYPDLQVKIFGTHSRPSFLPEDIEYIHNASMEQLAELYNSVRVFLCMSVNEGFGLTGAEAMACGCALVSTDYSGVFDYARNGENSLLVPVKDVNAAVQKVSELFENETLQRTLSQSGALDMQERSWANAVAMMENLLLQ